MKFLLIAWTEVVALQLIRRVQVGRATPRSGGSGEDRNVIDFHLKFAATILAHFQRSFVHGIAIFFAPKAVQTGMALRKVVTGGAVL